VLVTVPQDVLGRLGLAACLPQIAP